jgi:hypothetical protein
MRRAGAGRRKKLRISGARRRPRAKSPKQMSATMGRRRKRQTHGR